MKKNISNLLAGLLVSVILFLGIYMLFNTSQKVIAGLASTAQDILGTRSGTTTTGAFFSKSPANNGTTTSIIRNGGHTDIAVLSFKITAASSTPNGLLTWATFGSNDLSCQTATTTTTLANTVVMKDINWFATGNEGQITATGATATGTIANLSNLNWECLKVETNGSSTAAWGQIRVKNNSAVQL